MTTDSARKPADEDEDIEGETETGEGIPLKAARKVLGDLVIRAGVGNERIVITRNGKQAAALISIPDLERLRGLDSAAVGVSHSKSSGSGLVVGER